MKATSQNKESRVSVLLVEDDPLIAMDLAMQVEDLGYVVVGPFHTVNSALVQLDCALPDAAILDFNLKHGETSKPIAMQLIDAEVPLTFLTGYSSTNLLEQEGVAGHRVLSKPVVSSQLKTMLSDMVQP